LTTTCHPRSRNQRAGPFAIEFAGTPRAGKTTALHGLRRRLEERGFRVAVVEEQARLLSVTDKRHPHFNLRTGCATILKIVEALDEDVDVVLVDRGPFDLMAWTGWFRRVRRLTARDQDAFVACLQTSTLSGLIDLVLVMTVEPLEAMHRDGRTDSTAGPIMNRATLLGINGAIEVAVERNRCSREYLLERVDTTENDETVTLDLIDGIVGRHLPLLTGLDPRSTTA
jgi:thymidylate kinase